MAGPRSSSTACATSSDLKIKAEVDQAEALAEVALLEAKVAPPADKVRADLAALAEFDMNKAARSAVPEDKKAIRRHLVRGRHRRRRLHQRLPR